MKKPRYFLGLCALFLFCAFVISGCIPIIKASFDLTIGRQEKWNLVGVLVVPSASAEQLSQYLNQQFSGNQQLTQAGVTISVTPQSPDADGNVPIKLTMSGASYDSFRQAFGPDSLVVDDSSGSRVLVLNLNILSGLSAQATELSLHGGKILEHNGNLLNSTTVQWVNYTGTASARMQEPSLMDYLPWIIFGGGALVVLLGVIALVLVINLTRKKPAPQRAVLQSRQAYPGAAVSNRPPTASQPQPTYRPAAPPPAVQTSSEAAQAQSKFCVQCRAQIPVHAIFCPHCGAKQN